MAKPEQVIDAVAEVAKIRRNQGSWMPTGQWVDLIKKTNLPGVSKLTERRFKTIVNKKQELGANLIDDIKLHHYERGLEFDGKRGVKKAFWCLSNKKVKMYPLPADKKALVELLQAKWKSYINKKPEEPTAPFPR